MITPFDEDKNIDLPMVDGLVEWYIASGCAGIFSPCLSSEMFHMTPKERLLLAERVYNRAAGRVLVVSTGTYGPFGTGQLNAYADAGIEGQAAFVREMSKFCDAVVVVTAFMDPHKTGSDEVWQKNTELLLKLTPGIQLGLYECPVPYKRLLSPKLLAWCAQTGRFAFHKDTCCDFGGISQKIQAVRAVKSSPFRFYNANVETLVFSLRAGGHGFSGISANFYPFMHTWLVKQVGRADASDADKRKWALVQNFLTMAEAGVCIHYPASAKEYLALIYGLPIEPGCRKAEFNIGDQDRLRLQSMAAMCRLVCKEVGIEEIVPVKVKQVSVGK